MDVELNNVEAVDGPRQRLEKLCLEKRRCGVDDDEVEREILKLAQAHPQVFLADIVDKEYKQLYQCGPKESRRSPLSYLMSILKNDNRPVTIETFEAVYEACPAAIDSLDSWGGTVLCELLTHTPYFDDRLKHAWFDLLKAVISKSATLLTISYRYYATPILQAVEAGCSQEVVQYMIDHHPGDPFRQQSQYQHTLLAKVVKKAHNYSFDFIKYIFDGYPEAIHIQETDKYASTVFHAACCRGQEHILRFLLEAYPGGATFEARFRELALHVLMKGTSILGYTDLKAINKSYVSMVAFANPTAIFMTASCKNYNMYSPFSKLSKDIVYPDEDEGRRSGERKIELLWSYLFFFMNVYVYRFGNTADPVAAWNAPQHRVHMAASCPCPSNFLMYMAISSPHHLLQYDGEGRTVLALALESGHSQGCRLPNIHNHNFDDLIHKLVEVEPRALGLPDLKTQLYPFMTAACSEEQIVEMGILDDPRAKKGDTYGEECITKIRSAAPLTCLNTIYFLLRADPSKVSTGC